MTVFLIFSDTDHCTIIYPLFVQQLFIRYAEVVRLTATLVARWQAVGFTHGVLNTVR